MVTIVLSCSHCHSQNVIRFGKTTGGSPRYRCKDCKGTFSDAPPRGCSPDVKEKALRAYHERTSMRGIARVFGISRNTLTKWLKEKGGDCPK